MLSLSERCEAIVSLVPEGGIIIRAKFFVEMNVAYSINFYASSCRVSAEFTVVGMFVPLVINQFSIGCNEIDYSNVVIAVTE